MDAGTLQSLLEANEDEHLEFKEAKHGFHFETLVKYCCALANEGGGRIVLGVTDKRPRLVVGSTAFDDLERTRTGLTERLRLRVHTSELVTAEGKRVVIFEAPPRPLGVPVQYEGAYWMRSGDALVPMTPDKLRAIFDEATPDFSALVCPQASLDDLLPEAIEHFRQLWLTRSGMPELASLMPLQLLTDAELIIDGKPTFAALILLGSRQALGKHLAQAEVIYEYRNHEAEIDYQQREEFRAGFLLLLDRIWTLVERRNGLNHFQDGLIRREIATFNRTSVREALLNALCHRDYRNGGSVFVKQWPTTLSIISPGGFPPGISAENILFQQFPRNRRIAETLARCGLVERAGQGADRMFRTALLEGKLPPDYTHTGTHQVYLTLHGSVRDERLIHFFELIVAETNYFFRTEDFIAIDALHRGRPVPDSVTGRLPGLLDVGAIKRIGRGRYDLADRFFSLASDRAMLTRRRGLDRGANKALLLKHITDNASEGCPFDELTRVLPSLTTNQVKSLLRELRVAAEVHPQGKTRSARWFPGAKPSQSSTNQF